MKETIYTIPLNDAFHAEDECPFCRLERDAEQHALEFILGKQSSYMEDDIRMETDRIGFCRHHYKMMYDFGNRLGCGLMLSTHLKKLNEEMTRQIKSFTSGKSTLMGRLKKTDLNNGSMKKNTAAMSVTILMQPISVIWILSFICIKTAKNSKNFSKTAKDSVCITSVTLWKSEKKNCLSKKNRSFIRFFFL